MLFKKATTQDIKFIKEIKPFIGDTTILNRLQKQEKGLADFILLIDDDKPISFVLLNWQGKGTHPEYPDMEDLYTKESCRSKGYGTQLITECEERAKKRGFHKIGLAVNPNENSKALNLYQKLGYIHDGNKTYVDGVYDGNKDWVIDLEKTL